MMDARNMLDDRDGARQYRGPEQDSDQNWADSCGSYGAAWYCAEVLYGQDRRAEEELHKQKFEVCAPMVWERRPNGERTRLVQCPMFPGYVFVRFDMGRDRWRSIFGTRGIRTLLGPRPDHPRSLPDDLIRFVQENAAAESAKALKEAVVTKGDKVRVTKGACAGMDGVCLWSRNNRIGVLLNSMGQGVRVELPASRVRLV